MKRFLENPKVSGRADKASPILGKLSKRNTKGSTSSTLIIVVTANSLEGSRFVRPLKSGERFFRTIDLMQKAKFEAIAILAALVVSSFDMVATFMFPRVEA